MKTKLPLDLVLLDFRGEYEQQPRQAIHALQALLLDESACRARVAFLERVARIGLQTRPDCDATGDTATLVRDREPGQDPDDFAAEIRAILELGTFRALEQGQLSVDRLDALSRSPDALWRAHRELTADQDVETPRPARGVEPTGFTRLAERGDWPELASRLRPYLPEVLRTVGLDETLGDRLLIFLLEKAQTLAARGRRFRELMPEWLAEFAVQAGVGSLPRPLEPDDWKAIIDRAVVRIVLDREPEGESEWARQFRRTARQSRAASWQDLLRVPSPEAAPPMSSLERFRRDLIAQVQRERAEAFRIFELGEAA
jgi:hypothetical protein